MKLGATINALDSMKSNTADNYSSYTDSDDSYFGESDTYTSSAHSDIFSTGDLYDDLILDSDQEQQLEEAGIDSFEFELMDDDEKIEALVEAGLDPLDFDMY